MVNRKYITFGAATAAVAAAFTRGARAFIPAAARAPGRAWPNTQDALSPNRLDAKPTPSVPWATDAYGPVERRANSGPSGARRHDRPPQALASRPVAPQLSLQARPPELGSGSSLPGAAANERAAPGHWLQNLVELSGAADPALATQELLPARFSLAVDARLANMAVSEADGWSFRAPAGPVVLAQRDTPEIAAMVGRTPGENVPGPGLQGPSMGSLSELRTALPAGPPPIDAWAKTGALDASLGAPGKGRMTPSSPHPVRPPQGRSDAALKAFESDTVNAARLNQRALTEIVGANRDTDFGRAFRFAEVANAESPLDAYKAAVPLSTYADLEGYIDRIADGEPNVLTAEPVNFLAMTAGTTSGKSKRIPTTASSSALSKERGPLMGGLAAEMFPGASPSARSMNLMSASGPNGRRSAAGIPMGGASARAMEKMKPMFASRFSSPPEVFDVGDPQTAAVLHLVFGMQERDLSSIGATFAPYVLQLFETLEARQDEVLQSIASGRLPEALDVSEDQRAQLEAQLTPNPALAAQLRAELDQGMDGIAQRLWPQMSHVAAVVTGEFEVYKPKLQRYLGALPVWSPMLAATEGTIGINVSRETPKEYVILPGTMFYEFIPIEHADEAQPQTLDVTELEPDHQYELAVTTRAGLYRYRMGDVLEFKRYHNNAPSLEFAFRRGTPLDLAGEKTTYQHTQTALKDFAAQWLGADVELNDYTIAANIDAERPRYELYLELGKEHAALAADPERAAKLLDRCLGTANRAYFGMRMATRLSAPVVKLVAPGTFAKLRASSRTRSGASTANQEKVPRVVKLPEQIAILEEGTTEVGVAP